MKKKKEINELYRLQEHISLLLKDTEGLYYIGKLLEQQLEEEEKIKHARMIRMFRNYLNVIIKSEMKIFDDIDRYILDKKNRCKE